MWKLLRVLQFYFSSVVFILLPMMRLSLSARELFFQNSLRVVSFVGNLPHYCLLSAPLNKIRSSEAKRKVDVEENLLLFSASM